MENNYHPELTILMPCLNEAGTVGVCVEKAKLFLKDNSIEGEVVVADNNSIDGSADIARKAGARVVNVPERGYGNAIMGGAKEARGVYIIVGDADENYDFSALMPFLDKLREGNNLVMGNRFKGGIEPGAMPFSHRYIGNPVLTGFGNMLFGHICGDYYCGLRGFHRESILKLNLREQCMQFAVEMLIMAKLADFKIAEVPIMLHTSPETHKSHIERWRDGRKTILLFISLKMYE